MKPTSHCKHKGWKLIFLCLQQLMIFSSVTYSKTGAGKSLNLKHICLLSLQQHHPLFCINGHPGIYSGDVRLSADRRRRQGGENRVQEILKEEEEERSWVSVAQVYRFIPFHQGAAAAPLQSPQC